MAGGGRQHFGRRHHFPGHRRQPRTATTHRTPEFPVPYLRSHMTQTADAQRDASPILLAYSGGLDTSFLVPWLAENHKRPIITVTVDTGGIDAATAATLRDRSRQ